MAESPPSPEEPIPYFSGKPRKISVAAVFSVALGIIAIPLDIALFSGMIFGIIAIILGVYSVRRIKYSDALYGRPLAIAGIILGILSLLIGIGCGFLMFNSQF